MPAFLFERLCHNNTKKNYDFSRAITFDILHTMTL
jgi:hypothetical protein